MEAGIRYSGRLDREESLGDEAAEAVHGCESMEEAMGGNGVEGGEAIGLG